MWIRVRTMDGKISCRVNGLSKLTKIEDLRKMLVDKFDAPVTRQRLFYRGKQLEDGHTLYDYDVGLDDTVQIMIKTVDIDMGKTTSPSKQSINLIDKVDKENNRDALLNSKLENQISSQYFKIGDLVDAKDLTNGAWFEAKILDIKHASSTDKHILQDQQMNDQLETDKDTMDTSKIRNDGFIYRVAFEDYEDFEDPVDLSLHNIRPRARKLMKLEDLKKGDKVMVNYNIEEPKERGFWYDCCITDVKINRTTKSMTATIFIGADSTPLENCKIIFLDEIFAIEKTIALADKTSEENVVAPRGKMPKCTHCKDIPTRKCKICSCHICGGKDQPEKQILCDECDLPYHLWCLTPPLAEIPEEDDWYCPECKVDETEVVRAGEKLKTSKKKAKMASANSSTSRDWGKGMACVGRTKECTIVPSNHFGPIPGVEVGTLWKFRVQVSESGVHRPHVAGIHGRESDGAFSIVLSGGYEDDLDEGEEFKYTGSGGRDLSGNKRCAEQSCDQTLTRMNKALALNCNAPLNKNGAEAKDWKAGKPVRVVRNYKGRKHSEYCPETGNRYDGIYKVVKYWSEKGKSGYLVWRYLLRRDDPTPAPWTKAGKARIKELGLEMQYPEGYLESQEKEDAAESRGKKKGEKDDNPRSKKKRKVCYSVPSEVEKHIKDDKPNKKLWKECLEIVNEGPQQFLKKVEEIFSCICCQEVVFNPVTTVCYHNVCKSCLDRSFKAEVFSCPMCRHDLEKTCINQVNKNLQKALLSLFPGYDAGR
ncbi:E3 ubiquitin-protein ligase UHRF1 like protein [Argiope bruennichi]|uniref:RING-type E3 ubiquitin transferase n=1 Tax=Argiope bruennichi TaxID=94029 RepID=A0A8T0EL20_ARGBR|nr:E3 ubiquitin-protein ligase UHRF1 like protein [Argiope bruennichi]